MAARRVTEPVIPTLTLLAMLRDAQTSVILSSGRELSYIDADVLIKGVAEYVSDYTVLWLEKLLLGVHITEAEHILSAAQNDPEFPNYVALRVWAHRVNGKWNRDFIKMLRARATTQPPGVTDMLAQADPDDWAVKRYLGNGDVIVRLTTSGVIADVEAVKLV
ncbi:hypothetical protein HOU02_gp211 [Caulobacter phage CcrBL9]|uniref:Uncharacterized protein n=1 Tax=Caulobacter phage CcrBL9 TaxID=2283270 RepID=A0A385ECA2_9CAUD|nr:hypothetical protein HOU02_gp211 [Caulobacter phage CcrBL9]AXQ69514.1 hypothetical protein CcrBL9_gp490 [Caulobacter phage CcrBL9]